MRSSSSRGRRVEDDCIITSVLSLVKSPALLETWEIILKSDTQLLLTKGPCSCCISTTAGHYKSSH